MLFLAWCGHRGAGQHQAVAVDIGAGVEVDLLLDDWEVVLKHAQVELWDLELSSVSKFEDDALFLAEVLEQPHEGKGLSVVLGNVHEVVHVGHLIVVLVLVDKREPFVRSLELTTDW